MDMDSWATILRIGDQDTTIGTIAEVLDFMFGRNGCHSQIFDSLCMKRTEEVDPVVLLRVDELRCENGIARGVLFSQAVDLIRMNGLSHTT